MMKKLSTYFFQFRSQFRTQAGFTMIELLVVIAVIGVLAVAVLSSINPIEQINKGRDTRTRSDAAQLINAVDRYYAIHEVYPWNVDNASDAAGGDGFDAGTNVTPSTLFSFIGDGSTLISEEGLSAGETDWDWVNALSETAEVKEGFVQRLKDDNKLFLGKAEGYNETMYVCFQPTSNAFKQEAATNCLNQTTESPIAGVTTCEDGADIDALNLICLP